MGVRNETVVSTVSPPAGVGFSPIFLVTVAVILPSDATTTLMVAESVASAVSFAVIVASPAALEVITIFDLSAL